VDLAESMSKDKKQTQEHRRLEQRSSEDPIFPWYKWGPYVAERSWGTVREDYSPNGDAWNYFSYDMAKAKAFVWGEDGIAGLCDRFQIIALTFAFWNEQDSELKERLFGVNPSEANHGEDVKEYYYYLDNTPTHSYMKYLYKYPHGPFPYEQLVVENRKRDKYDLEYELLDTHLFDHNNYFDIFIEYAKNTPEDIVIKVEVCNRSDREAPFHLVPQLLFRNSHSQVNKLPECSLHKEKSDSMAIICDDFQEDSLKVLPFTYALGKRYFYGNSEASALFTNNQTNEKLLTGKSNTSPYVKDAFHRYIVHKELDAVNPRQLGTKAALHYQDRIGPKKSKVYLFRFTPELLAKPLHDVENIIHKRKQEADEFYAALHPKGASEDVKNIQRQALSGMLWGKQFYFFDVDAWLKAGPSEPALHANREEIRNKHWKHLLSMRIMSMPDKWEYPWFAAWDLAFHCISLALVDMEFAKEQLWFLLFDQFQHPNGQIPAYEWDFSELNPPVQGWAALRLYQMELQKTGKKDRYFLEKCFHKLMMNFTWWVNKVDSHGNNVFEGGFLGLDNITVIDRSVGIPAGGRLEQSDGTGWMGMFCLTLMRMALELAKEDSVYEIAATKFFEHYVYIAAALHHSQARDVQIWNEKEGFFYDVMSFSNGHRENILVRSLVGVIPLYAIDVITEKEINALGHFAQNFHWFLRNRKDLTDRCVSSTEQQGEKKYIFSLMNPTQMKRVLTKVWDPKEFRSEYGLRSLSKIYEKNPYVLLGNSIAYEPGESIAILKGGNSNWRGPIWFPTTFLLIDSLRTLHDKLEGSFTIDFEGQSVTAGEMAKYFAKALLKIFERDASHGRPFFGEYKPLQTDPHWKDYLLFYEHFHGETGRGLGASHQTGWTGLIANIIDEWI